jgi:ABC-type transport system involved in cytochrome bd biosynthesis fused ATPase/permease subunit
VKATDLNLPSEGSIGRAVLFYRSSFSCSQSAKMQIVSEEKTVQNISIQVKDLQKSYKQLNVLKGVDFTVDQSSIFALLGSNGVGKTTIVKILTTLLKHDGGTAIVNGFDVASKPHTTCGNQSV